jgi:uncharacterized protein (TIGR03435 family)
MRAFVIAATLSGAIFGQTAKPAFDVADVHASAHVRNLSMQGGVLRAGRFEIRRATMLDLIKIAYGVDADTVFGGPSWLEWDRFDVIAKAPPATSQATVKLMLQALLADRFKLAVHRDTKPIQGFVLTVGKGKPKLREADGSGDAGCPSSVQREAATEPYRVAACRNLTMEAFAVTLRGLDSRYFIGPVADQTGLAGAWDFDLTWTDKRNLPYAGEEGITIFDAVDKQLGLKLEPGKVPMPVLVVDRVNENPTANSPAVTTLLPPLPRPEFEVASIRPSLPGAAPGGRGFMPGGRVEWRGLPLNLMIRDVWDQSLDPGEAVAGAPKWLKLFQPQFDLIAKAPATSTISGAELFYDDYALMIKALLLDRFKMKVHYEDRPMDAYTLVAAKPKLKKADPSIRTGCTEPAPAKDRLIAVTCRNITMAQFAERLSDLPTNYLRYPVLNATGLSGGWDLSVTFDPVPPSQLAAAGSQGGARAGRAAGGPEPVVSSDPVGGISLFDAVEKQLGLKLEVHKRPEPVFVIDHIEEKPTDN